MFITTAASLKDPAIVAAMQSIRLQEMAEAQRRADIRSGKIPAPQGQWQEWHISDRH